MGKVPDFEKARDYCIHRLENELSPNLTYHRLEHTTKEVVPATDQLATMEKVNDEDRLLLLTGAYYHDLGFIQQRQGHELVSIRLAEQTLPLFDYSGAEVDIIRGIIRATCIPQSPTNLLEKIMTDADLDYLGRDNFWERSDDLRHELENHGGKFTDEDWYLYQLHFIQKHQYFTISEQSLRNASKKQHLLQIQARLGQTIQARTNK